MTTAVQLILGSQSSRRREVLEFFSLPFIQVPSHFLEEKYPFKGDPISYALELSDQKASLLQQQFPQELVLTADTIVFCEGKVFNKPKDKEEAFQFLSELSGKWHSVYTGMTLAKSKEKFHGCEETKILLHHLTPKQIRLYHQHLFFSDKAGGYAIQKAGSMIVSRIDGCYYNVMGMPLNTLKKLLLKVGIDLWDHLKPF
jgi:septum formation protein